MSLDKLLDNIRILAVVCNQFGDSGKGKFVDYFSSNWANVVARGTGGNNAGHTIIVNGREKVFHLLPVGVAYDSSGVISILGNGMVLDVKVLAEELDELDNEGATYNHLRISEDATVIMPWHIAIDQAKNQSQKDGGIGSTGRGIGPAYADKVARKAVKIRDLFNTDTLVKKVLKLSEIYPDQNINAKDLVEYILPFVPRIKPFVRDTVTEMHQFVREGKKILLEGAQGLLLSIEHGVDPYVTSSDCSLNGTASGVGLPANAVDLSIGLIKFPFMTRVGGGPFPTEIGGLRSEKHCGEGFTKKDELERFGIKYEIQDGKIKYNPKDEKILQMMNSQDTFIKGIGIRLAAGEYGATTGRPRRVGCTDAVAARYAVGINGPIMALTKVDCMSGADSFNICYDYQIDAQRDLRFKRDAAYLRKITPQYQIYGGYGKINSAGIFKDLPARLMDAIRDFEIFTSGKVVVVSTGPEKEQTIVR
ncbi:adenylosuccinate synthetase [Candidatus Woesearchaeota archaeon]|nr:adenylosuccinate synthetase [Candidatus Woesearchaeota archaeon]